MVIIGKKLGLKNVDFDEKSFPLFAEQISLRVNQMQGKLNINEHNLSTLIEEPENAELFAEFDKDITRSLADVSLDQTHEHPHIHSEDHQHIHQKSQASNVETPSKRHHRKKQPK